MYGATCLPGQLCNCAGDCLARCPTKHQLLSCFSAHPTRRVCVGQCVCTSVSKQPGINLLPNYSMPTYSRTKQQHNSQVTVGNAVINLHLVTFSELRIKYTDLKPICCVVLCTVVLKSHSFVNFYILVSGVTERITTVMCSKCDIDIRIYREVFLCLTGHTSVLCCDTDPGSPCVRMLHE